MTARTVTVAGRPIRVAVRPGRARSRPLVVCNGIGAGLEILDPFVDALDPALEVVRFDVPGVGGSPTAPFPYGFPGTAWLLAGVLGELDYGRVDVLGLSWGGALAQQFALQHPGLVRRLVLVAGGAGALMVPGRPEVVARLLTRRRYRDPDYATRVVAGIYGGSARRDPERVRALLGETVPTGSELGYLHQLLAGAFWTTLPALPLLACPTLILQGDDDPLVPPDNGRILSRLIPDARLHLYRGGHVELVVQPDLLVPLIEDFLAPDRRRPARAA